MLLFAIFSANRLEGGAAPSYSETGQIKRFIGPQPSCGERIVKRSRAAEAGTGFVATRPLACADTPD